MKFITFGEIMMRLSTPVTNTFDSNDSFDVNIGGSEMNVALSLAASEIETSMVTTLPDNKFGTRVMRLLKSHDVNTEGINLKDGRIGINFVEQGFNLRPSSVIYDRKHSSFEASCREDYDFDALLKDYDWFHFSGITAALNETLQQTLFDALESAKKNGLKISMDLNYRGSLWSFSEARRVMSQYAPYCDLIIGYEPLELLEEGKDIKDGLERNPDPEVLNTLLDKIHDAYGIKYIAFTQRESISGNRNILTGFLSKKNELYQTSPHEVEILERIGSGDAYTAGIIHGLINELDYDAILQNALGNMLYKHTITGDFLTRDIGEMHHLLDGSKEVRR